MSETINIRDWRKAKDWTQDQLAAFFGVDKATVWRWENKGIPKRGPARQAIERAIGSPTSQNGAAQSADDPPLPDAAA